MDKRHILDLVDEALTRTTFDMRLGEENRRSRLVFIDYLRGRVLDRKCDCDEYRALRKFAGRE